MTEPNYKTLLTSKFVEDLRSVYNSVWENRKEIRADLDDEMWCNDIDWSVVEYFIWGLQEVAEYLENK